MVSITLSVPEETRALMKQFPEINWSGFIRKTLEEKTARLQKIAELKQQEEKEKDLTQWAVKLQKEGRKGRSEFLQKKGLLG